MIVDDYTTSDQQYKQLRRIKSCRVLPGVRSQTHSKNFLFLITIEFVKINKVEGALY